MASKMAGAGASKSKVVAIAQRLRKKLRKTNLNLKFAAQIEA